MITNNSFVTSDCNIIDVNGSENEELKLDQVNLTLWSCCIYGLVEFMVLFKWILICKYVNALEKLTIWIVRRFDWKSLGSDWCGCIV